MNARHNTRRRRRPYRSPAARRAERTQDAVFIFGMVCASIGAVAPFIASLFI